MAQLIPAAPASGFRADDMQLFQNVHRMVWNPARRGFASKDQSSGTGFGNQLGFEPLPEGVFRRSSTRRWATPGLNRMPVPSSGFSTAAKAASARSRSSR